MFEKLKACLLKDKFNYIKNAPIHLYELFDFDKKTNKIVKKNEDKISVSEHRIKSTFDFINKTSCSHLTIDESIITRQYIAEFLEKLWNKFHNTDWEYTVNDINKISKFCQILLLQQKHYLSINFWDTMTDDQIDTLIDMLKKLYTNKEIKLDSIYQLLNGLMMTYTHIYTDEEVKQAFDDTRTFIESSLYTNANTKKRIKYERVRKISSGSYGKIYKVIRLYDKHIFAEKMNFMGLDLTEIDIMRKIQHENILACQDLCVTNNETLHLIMGRAETDLESLIDNNKVKYTEKQALSIMYDLCSALYFLHNNSMFIHCDIKPPNVLLFPKSNEPGDYSACLADFGFSSSPKYLDHFCGTLGFAPPETMYDFKGTKRAYVQTKDFQAADIFSLGCVLYRLFTKRYLISVFGDDEQQSTQEYNQYIDDQEAAFANFDKYYKKCFGSSNKQRQLLKEMIMKMTSPLISQRYTSMRDVFNDKYMQLDTNTSTPRSGYIQVAHIESCSTLSTIQEHVQNMINDGKNYNLHTLTIYQAVLLYYRLQNMKNLGTNHQSILRDLAFYLAIKLENLQEETIMSMYQTLFQTKEFKKHIIPSIIHLHGTIRTPCLDDVATSLDEREWGLEQLLDCSQVIKHPAQLHVEYQSQHDFQIGFGQLSLTNDNLFIDDPEMNTSDQESLQSSRQTSKQSSPTHILPIKNSSKQVSKHSSPASDEEDDSHTSFDSL